MYELSLLLWDIFCIKKIWFNSFIQKIQEVQHANLTAVEKSNQSSYHVNSCAENLTESEAVMK